MWGANNFAHAKVELRRGILASIVFLLSAATVVSAAETRRVLLLHSFGHPFSPWSNVAATFRAALIKRSPEPIDLYEVSLDTSRVQSPQDETPFIDYIHALAGQKLDLIVSVGAPAAFFVQRHQAQLFATTPMLILGADSRRIPREKFSDNETGVLVELDLPAYLRNILRLLPDTRQISAVIGNSPVERFWMSEAQRDFEPFANRVKIEWLNNLTFNETLKHAAAMPLHSAIFWTVLSEDAAGIPYTQDRALEQLREGSAAPVFGVGDYELGRGIIGGPLLQTEVIGREGADVALRILNGEAPRSINPPLVLFGAPHYDWRELRRWNIAESLLPADSVVQFREPTAWEQYRWQILLTAAVIIGQALLIAYVLFQNRRRRLAEAEAAEQRREVAHLMRVSVLGELSGAIAHEVNQPLTAILSNAQAALRLLAQQSPDLVEVREAITDIVSEDNRAGDVIGRLRNLLKKGERKFEQIDVNELANSTIVLLNSELIGRRIVVEKSLAHSLPSTRGDPVQLQQVLLNLLMNAMDAMASTPDAQRRIRVTTTSVAPDRVEIRIRDRGVGFKSQKQDELFKPFYTSKANGLGLGLTICSTIAHAHGGKLTLSNHAERGAIAVFSLPAHEQLVAMQ